MTRTQVAQPTVDSLPMVPLLAQGRPMRTRRAGRAPSGHGPVLPRQREPSKPSGRAGDGTDPIAPAPAEGPDAPLSQPTGVMQPGAALALPGVEPFRWLREYPPGMLDWLLHPRRTIR